MAAEVLCGRCGTKTQGVELSRGAVSAVCDSCLDEFERDQARLVRKNSSKNPAADAADQGKKVKVSK